MIRTNLLIQKKRFFGTGYSRWYSVGKVSFGDFSGIQTESQFCLWLLRTYGTGRFMITATRKGRKGLWVFWIGELTSQTFKRDRKDNVWINLLPREQLGMYPQEYYPDEVVEEGHREHLIKKKKHRSRNLYGLVPSSPPGNCYNYEEYDINLMDKEQGELW